MVEKYDDNEPVQPNLNVLSPEDGEKSDRQGFIRKVYAILSAQLCVTGMAITAVQMNPALH